MFNRIWFDADKGDGSGGNANGGGGSAGDKPEAKFTQADVDRIVGDRARRAEESAVNTLLKELGFEKADDLKALVTDAKKHADDQKTEAQKLQDQIAQLGKEKAAADEARKAALAQANERLMKAAVLTEAAKADYGFRPDALSDVWLFLDRANIKPKSDASDEFEGITEALKAVAKAKPYLVAEAAGDGRGTPRPGSNRAAGGQASEEELLKRKRATGAYQSL